MKAKYLARWLLVFMLLLNGCAIVINSSNVSTETGMDIDDIAASKAIPLRR